MAGPLVNGSRVPVCMQTTANMKAAVSPAFEIDGKILSLQNCHNPLGAKFFRMNKNIY